MNLHKAAVLAKQAAISINGCFRVLETLVVIVIFYVESILFKKIGKGQEEDEGKNVPVNREHNLADPHVKCSPGNDMETGIAELQGQHGQVQLHLLRNRAYSLRHS